MLKFIKNKASITGKRQNPRHVPLDMALSFVSNISMNSGKSESFHETILDDPKVKTILLPEWYSSTHQCQESQ